METLEIRFSLRDALRGSRLLFDLGFIRSVELTEVHQLELDIEDQEHITEECEALDLEFEWDTALHID